jgi:hypothetical protein
MEAGAFAAFVESRARETRRLNQVGETDQFMAARGSMLAQLRRQTHRQTVFEKVAAAQEMEEQEGTSLYQQLREGRLR